MNHTDKLFVPYRICPLGAHIDHQLGIVTGFSIDKGIQMDYKKNMNGSFHIVSHDFAGEVVFDYHHLPEINGLWQDYLVGSILALQEHYELKNGIDAYIYEALPVGGLASSSAIIISYILAITKVNDIPITDSELVNLVVRVESKYLNIKVGLLDPYCEVYCRNRSFLYLDTKTGNYQLRPLGSTINFKICLIYSGISRKLGNTLYNVRVDECKCVAFLLNSLMQRKPIEFKDSYLRDISYKNFKKYQNNIPIHLVKRANHFYTEMERVKKGLKYLEEGDITKFGKLVFESGDSSIENYEVGSEQLEELQTILRKTDGVYGARCSGAGFHGYCFALIDPEKEEKIRNFITQEYLTIYPEYKEQFKIYFCNIGDGIKL